VTQLALIQSDKDKPQTQLVDLSGFESYYSLLRALVAVQDEASFYERLRVLLILARWQDDPPTVITLARVLAISPDALSPTLNVLRSSGWLRENDDERHYSLSDQGRILIILLQLLAQPWQEGDVSSIAMHLYGAAEDLGLRHDLLSAQFETVLSTLEERARKIETALSAEDTRIVSGRLHESRRDVQIAHKALELRQRGAIAPDDYAQSQRMHQALSKISEYTARLDVRYQKLLARDLLAQGLVTLGDIHEWARHASLEELAESILPHLQLPFLSIWAIPEFALVDSALEVAGKVARSAKTHPPHPVPLESLPPPTTIDEIKQKLHRKQEELRIHLRTVDPLPLSEWVDQKNWDEAVIHFISSLDPELHQSSIPVYLQLDSQGNLDLDLKHAAEAVTVGRLSLEELKNE